MTVQQESIPAESREAEIPRITFAIQNTSSGPLKRGLGGGDFFNCLTDREAKVCLYKLGNNLALMCAGQNRHGVENERVSQERSSDPS